MCKTDYGGGSINLPKIDYVICERPLSVKCALFSGPCEIVVCVFSSVSLYFIGLQPIKTRAE